MVGVGRIGRIGRFGPGRRAAAAPIGPIDPATLYASGEAGAWWDPSDLTTLFQDAAGTTPVTADGQPVLRMNDKSGNGRHLTSDSSARAPVYKTDGTRHWLLTDGTDDYLEVLFALSQPWQRVSGIRTNAWVSGGRVFGRGAGGANGQLLMNGSSPRLDMFSGNLAPVTSGVAVGADAVITETVNGASSSIAPSSGAAATIGDTGTGAVSGVTIARLGSDTTGAANIRFYGAIMRAGLMTSDQLTGAKLYMKAKCGEL